ncbi:bZIP transcription factor bZIP-1 [Penicillium atrosanguineum]|nr:bZIP transcription factor bZIP-1 [Penicillium atrosanguineum]
MTRSTPLGFNNGPQRCPVNGETFTGRIKREVPFDFYTVPAHNLSEMDAKSSYMENAPYFFSAKPNMSKSVDHNALGGHELDHARSSLQAGRAYPGIHQQQAAIAAKAA